LEKIISFARTHCEGKVIVVFGCAGLRDIDKRYLMGRISGRLSDVSIVTAEDPRTERVEDITAQIVTGILEEGAEEYPPESLAELGSESVQDSLREHMPLFMRIPDRRKAIITAIGVATERDIVLVCGKGHEKSMCFGVTEVAWSDQSVVEEAVRILEV
jgi:UDP-N-acetylmuramoyl-L-alanyl-D-glutamate--2,6-diaminopimelate ligase